jgi:3-deoxy-7-phosphoheptulonate synthase
MTMISLEPETTVKNSLLTPEELHKEIPLTEEHSAFVLRSRETVEAILNGWDTRRLLIIGPCSIHDLSSARDYAQRLSQLATQVCDQFFIVMRAYFEKPRTILGWKGMLYDPDIDGSYNMAKGVWQTRQLLAELTEMHVPVGCELLEINTASYYADFLSWGCIGARTSSSPPHRQLAASLNLPIGFKNSIDGNIDHSIHGIIAAAAPHIFLGLSTTGQLTRMEAEGNPLCHVVLRGGISGPNYHPEAVKQAIQKCRQAQVRDKIIIDCSHDNCGKKPLNQLQVFESVMEQILEGNTYIAGMMLESHLEGGAQEIAAPLLYGVSITDPCIDWETTESLIREASYRMGLGH